MKASKKIVGALLIGGNVLVSSPSFSQNIKDTIDSTSFQLFDVVTGQKMDSSYLAFLPDLDIDWLHEHCGLDQFNHLVTHYVFQGTNTIRKEHGLHDLVIDSTLMQTAYLYAQEMAKTKHYSHISLQGKTPLNRVINQKYPALFVGENISYNQESINEALLNWKNSPAHLKNIIDPCFTDIGIACVDNYWVVVFGAKKVSIFKEKD